LSPAVMNQSFKILQSMKLANSSLSTISNALCRHCQAQSDCSSKCQKACCCEAQLMRHTACAIITEF
jgi:hypothetical protein